MTYKITAEVAAPTTFVSGEENKHFTRSRFHTFGVVGTTDLELELNDSGDFFNVGTYTDQLINFNGYGYTRLRVTPTGSAKVVIFGADEAVK
jgi:hypothetical protein